MIEHLVHLGFEVRVELVLAGGDGLWAQITQAEAEQLELQKGQIVYVRPSRGRVFDRDDGRPSGDDTPSTEELQAA
ncbi:MAG TPA: TOBE-like domain-containing protein, partial [Solirubrobacterales bacterium]|nr:TOBE-like domain-containing protein [Solirubrobacterales bacterium]